MRRYERDNAVSKRAIYGAKFKCELDRTHESFIAKSGHPYLEAHHLIPISAQDDFSVSLDVEANIVALCPNCHRKLHCGKDIDFELKRLYDDRITNLKKCGISITFDELIKYYK